MDLSENFFEEVMSEKSTLCFKRFALGDLTGGSHCFHHGFSKVYVYIGISPEGNTQSRLHTPRQKSLRFCFSPHRQEAVLTDL